METKTDEDHLDNTAIPLKDTEPAIPNQEPEKMEVQKHPHHVMHKKKWGEYLLEFFMLFLAVFLGFVAENIRETSVERHQEKEYMRLMVDDLKKDTANINVMVAGNRILIRGLDSLLDLLSGTPNSSAVDNQTASPSLSALGNDQKTLKPDKQVQRRIFILSLKYTYWYMPLQFSELTITQLKSNGGFRLLKNREVTNAILQYNQGLDACKYNYDLLLNYFHAFEATNKDLFNMTLARKAFKVIERDFKTVFLPYDEFEKLVPEGNYFDKNEPALLLRYHDDILYYQTTLSNLTNIVANQKLSSDSLMQLIITNYPMEE